MSFTSGRSSPTQALDKKDSLRSFVKILTLWLLLWCAASFIFFHSFWGFIPTLILLPFYLKKIREHYSEKRRKEMEEQFVFALQNVSGYLTAGYSMEKAWHRVEKDMTVYYGSKSPMVLELTAMNRQIDMNVPMEKVISDFASRTDIEDIWNFAQVFRYAKRSGGNISEIIKTTASRIQGKASIVNEIETKVSAKKMEQRLITVMLPGVILFLTFSSPDYMEILYHTLPGLAVMTVCMVGYMVSIFWAEKIIDIKV